MEDDSNDCYNAQCQKCGRQQDGFFEGSWYQRWSAIYTKTLAASNHCTVTQRSCRFMGTLKSAQIASTERRYRNEQTKRATSAFIKSRWSLRRTVPHSAPSTLPAGAQILGAGRGGWGSREGGGQATCTFLPAAHCFWRPEQRIVTPK